MNNTTGQQNWQSAQRFEQLAQQAAEGEQKAREFNARNSTKINTQTGQFMNVNQQELMNQNITNNQTDQDSQQLERQAQQAAQGEQKARNFNDQNSDD